MALSRQHLGSMAVVTPPEDAHRINVSRLLSKHVDPELKSFKQQIDWCKREECDFIASLHWGFEFEFFPRKRQVEAARELVEYGADAIFCHHPHVIQPVEYYRIRRDPSRVAVIAYSLGSLTWGFTAPHLVLSLLLDLKLTKGSFCRVRNEPTLRKCALRRFFAVSSIIPKALKLVWRSSRITWTAAAQDTAQVTLPRLNIMRGWF